MSAKAGHLAIRAVMFEKAAPESRDTLLQHDPLIWAAPLFPERHDEGLVQMAHQVELGVALAGKPVQGLGDGAFRARPAAAVPLRDLERVVFPEVNVNVLLAVTVGDFQERREEHAEVAKPRDSAAFMVPPHIAEHTMARAPTPRKT